METPVGITGIRWRGKVHGQKRGKDKSHREKGDVFQNV